MLREVPRSSYGGGAGARLMLDPIVGDHICPARHRMPVDVAAPGGNGRPWRGSRLRTNPSYGDLLTVGKRVNGHGDAGSLNNLGECGCVPVGTGVGPRRRSPAEVQT